MFVSFLIACYKGFVYVQIQIQSESFSFLVVYSFIGPLVEYPADAVSMITKHAYVKETFFHVDESNAARAYAAMQPDYLQSLCFHSPLKFENVTLHALQLELAARLSLVWSHVERIGFVQDSTTTYKADCFYDVLKMLLKYPNVHALNWVVKSCLKIAYDECTQISNARDFMLSVIKLLAARIIDTNYKHEHFQLLLNCKSMGVHKLIQSGQLNAVFMAKWLNEQLCAGSNVFTCEFSYSGRLCYDPNLGREYIQSKFTCISNNKQLVVFVREF